MSDSAFELRQVSQQRRGRDVLRDVSLTVPAGAVTVLVGPSGAGKSTLLRLLNRLDEPASGTVLYMGQPLGDYPVRELRRRVGFVFQTPVMFAGDVRDNLLEAARLGGGPAEEPLLGRVLEQAGLPAELLDRPGEELSVGERQRVNLARTLMAGPEAIVLDEPTSALDPERAGLLVGTIRALAQREGMTVVLASHRLSEARAVAQFAVMIAAGRIVETGPASRVLGRPLEPETRDFLRHET